MPAGTPADTLGAFRAVVAASHDANFLLAVKNSGLGALAAQRLLEAQLSSCAPGSGSPAAPTGVGAAAATGAAIAEWGSSAVSRKTKAAVAEDGASDASPPRKTARRAGGGAGGSAGQIPAPAGAPVSAPSSSSSSSAPSASATSSSSSLGGSLARALESTFLGMLVGDAISVPLHWYYDHGALRRDRAAHLAQVPGAVDAVTGLQASIVGIPPAMRTAHPTSAKYFRKVPGKRLAALGVLHSTGAVKRWDTPGTHYHATLPAGHSSTTTALALLLMRLLVSHKRYRSRKYLSEFEAFFETPGAREDFYVSEVHRHYFRKKAEGVPPTRRGANEECASAMTLFLPLLGFLAAARFVPPADNGANGASGTSAAEAARGGGGTAAAQAVGGGAPTAVTDNDDAIVSHVCAHIRLHHNTANIVAQTTKVSELLLALWALPPPAAVIATADSSGISSGGGGGGGGGGRASTPTASGDRSQSANTSQAADTARTAEVRRLLAETFTWFYAQMGSKRQYPTMPPTIDFFAGLSPEELFWGADAYAMSGAPGAAHFSLR